MAKKSLEGAGKIVKKPRGKRTKTKETAGSDKPYEIISSEYKPKPKFTKMTPMQLRLWDDQIEFLIDLEREIGKARPHGQGDTIRFPDGRELVFDRRITRMTILRCILQLFMDKWDEHKDKFNIKEPYPIVNEDVLLERLREAF